MEVFSLKWPITFQIYELKELTGSLHLSAVQSWLTLVLLTLLGSGCFDSLVHIIFHSLSLILILADPNHFNPSNCKGIFIKHSPAQIGGCT